MADQSHKWKREPTTMSHFKIVPHGSEMLVQHSNRWRDLPLLVDNNQMVSRKVWNEFRRDRWFSLSAAESCWVQARRAWQLLVILAWGKGGAARHFSVTVSRHVVLHHRDQDPEIRGAASGQIRREADSLTTVQYLFGKIKVESSAQFSCPPSSPPPPPPHHPFRHFLCHGWVWNSLMDTNMNTSIVTNT